MLKAKKYKVTVTKIKKGCYKLQRNDGYSMTVTKGYFGNYWYSNKLIERQKLLSEFVYDMEMGYLARDNLK